MKYIKASDYTKDLESISSVKENHLGFKIKDYYPESKKYKKIVKGGIFPLLKQNLNFNQKCFLELHINKELSLYYSTISKQVCNFRIGCFIGKIDECWDLEKESIEQIFNLIHNNNTTREFKRFLRYVKILKSKVEKTPYKREWKLRKNAFFVKILSIKDSLC